MATDVTVTPENDINSDNRPEWRNSFVIINTSRNERFALEAGGDRVIVQEDRFRTGYECKTCDGNRWQKNSTCPSCRGLKYVGEMGSKDASVCRLCEGSGLAQCPDCKGKGGIVIVPEDVMRRPTSGVIKSIGYRTNYDPDMRDYIKDEDGKPYWKVGDRVIFALFAGTAIDFKQRGSCRILSRNELMGKIHGVGSLGDAIK